MDLKLIHVVALECIGGEEMSLLYSPIRAPSLKEINLMTLEGGAPHRP